MNTPAGELMLGTRHRKLSRAARRHQLLETALQIVREEGTDRLTLGHLATQAGVSKPIAYEHFGTRSGLLIELYRLIDIEQVRKLRAALEDGVDTLEETADILATTYIHCSADTNGDWQAVGSALVGSDEKDAVFQELIDGYVQLFATALAPHTALGPESLERYCIGLVGAGEALAAAMLRGNCSETEAAKTFAALIVGTAGPWPCGHSGRLNRGAGNDREAGATAGRDPATRAG